MGNAKSNPGKGEGRIGFLSEATGKKKHLSKCKGAGKNSASRTKESSSKAFDYALKIPNGTMDISNLTPKRIPDFDISSVAKTNYKKPKDYSKPENIISNWSSYSVDKASENEKSGHVQSKGKSSFLSIKGILKIFAIIVLACILANATVALLIFLSTPAGQMFSIVGFLCLFIWMKKKGWLPL